MEYYYQQVDLTSLRQYMKVITTREIEISIIYNYTNIDTSDTQLFNKVNQQIMKLGNCETYGELISKINSNYEEHLIEFLSKLEEILYREIGIDKHIIKFNRFIDITERFIVEFKYL